MSGILPGILPGTPKVVGAVEKGCGSAIFIFQDYCLMFVIALQELYEMRCRLDEADRIILLAEERLHEHNIIDENLSAMLAKVKMHSEAELRRFKQESEISYQNGVGIYLVIFICLDNKWVWSL